MTNGWPSFAKQARNVTSNGPQTHGAKEGNTSEGEEALGNE